MKKNVCLVGEAIVLGRGLFRVLCFVVICGFIHSGCGTFKLGEGGVLTAEEEARVIDYFEGLLADMPTEEPSDPDESPIDEPVVGDVFVSLGGKQIPSNKINSSSDDYLWKPRAESGGSVALLPAKFWGAVSDFKVNGVKFRDTSRDHDLPNSEAFPNGARVHLRAKEMQGKGVVTCMVNGERYVAFIPDLSRRDSNWKLVAQSEVIEPEEPEPTIVDDDVFVSLGGKQIPLDKIDSSSDDYLWKPKAEGGGSVALLPAKFWGAVSDFKVNGVKFRDTSRDHDLPNSAAFPNGARVHLRAKEMRGKGVVTCMVNGERHVASIPDLSRRNSSWKLVAQSEVTEPEESDPNAPLPLTGPPVAFDGVELRVAPSLATGKMVLHRAGLAATGFVIGKPGPQVFKVPATHRNGTAQGQIRGKLIYDVDMQGTKARLKAVYTNGSGFWPEDVDRAGWRKFGSPASEPGSSEAWQKWVR